MAVISRTDITKLIEKGDIVVKYHPMSKYKTYPQDKIGNCSMDIRLGGIFFRQRAAGTHVFPYKEHRNSRNACFRSYEEYVQNNTDERAMDKNMYEDQCKWGFLEFDIPSTIWNPSPMQPASVLRDGSAPGIETGTRIITLQPGETILAISEEFIGCRRSCTTMLKTKSTIARLGMDICGSSGWGDIGYINRWTFPLRNRSNCIIHLLPGTWIGQIIFLSVSGVEESYVKGGNYQSTDDIDKLITSWEPEDVLPKYLSNLPDTNSIQDAKMTDIRQTSATCKVCSKPATDFGYIWDNKTSQYDGFPLCANCKKTKYTLN